MPDQNDLDSEILSSYLAGEMTSHEKVLMDQWVEKNPSRRIWLKKMQFSWEAMPPEQIPELNLDEFKSRLNQARSYSNPQKTHSRSDRAGSSPSLSTFFRLTAIAGLIVVSWVAGFHQKTSDLSELTSTYTTGRGERATITLPDGSSVVLNVDSRLEIPSDFATGKRTVRLTGEALFTVVHKNRAPFIVRADNSTTKVLGTRFTVRRYESDTATLVAVRDGKVMVEDSVITTNQQITVYTDGLSAIKPVGYGPFTFVQGIMTLENTTLINAIPELARWYNIEIRIGDTAINYRNITGEFSAGSISELVEILEWTFDIKVVKNGRILTLFPK